MKKAVLPLFFGALTSLSYAGGTAGGPWANGAYFSGNLNGKYMGVVTGNNIAGVLGFAIVDGAPPYRPQAAGGGDQQSLDNAAKVADYQDPRIDITQNYFAIFVEGRTYTGLTTAGVDINSKTVAGAMQGTDPIGVQATVTGAPGPGDFAVNSADGFNAANALSIVNRGLSGGFTAKIEDDKAAFTFAGEGQLSTPANRQNYQIENQIIGLPAAQTNTVVSGIYETESTPFQVKGSRTSFNAYSQQTIVDQTAAAPGGN